MKIYTLTECNETRYTIERTLFRNNDDAVKKMIERKEAIMLNRSDLGIIFETESQVVIGWINDEIDEPDDTYIHLFIKEEIVH